MTLFDSEEFKKMVDEITAIQNQEKTIVYMTELQKDVLKKYFDVELPSDDCIYQTKYGRYRFINLIGNKWFNLLENQNVMCVINGIYESEDK